MATQPIPEAEQILHVPLTEIKLSNTNPRSDIDEQELAELAADIAASRVHEPVLVRPKKGDTTKYDLVFGERRYRASQRAQKRAQSIVGAVIIRRQRSARHGRSNFGNRRLKKHFAGH